MKQLDVFEESIETKKWKLGVYGQLNFFEPIKELCPECDGDGGYYYYGQDWADCSKCNGKGTVNVK